MTNEKHAAYYAAIAADEAFSKAIRDAGFKSRWELPPTVMKDYPEIAKAYCRKVNADETMHAERR